MRAHGGRWYPEDTERASGYDNCEDGYTPSDSVVVRYDNGSTAMSALVPEGMGEALATIVNAAKLPHDIRRAIDVLLTAMIGQGTEVVLADPEGWRP